MGKMPPWMRPEKPDLAIVPGPMWRKLQALAVLTKRVEQAAAELREYRAQQRGASR